MKQGKLLNKFNKAGFALIQTVLCLGVIFAAQNVHAAPAASPDGSGTMIVAGTTAPAGSTGNSFTFSFDSGSGVNMDGGEVTLVVPAGWTTPQTSSSTTAGYVSLTTNAGNHFSIGTITGTGPWTIPINCAAGSGMEPTFVLTYAGGGTKVTAPATAGTYTFTTQQKSSAAGTLTNIATQPQITVTVTTQLIVTLPGQTFTSGSGNSGTVTAQAAGVPFNIVSITETDASLNVVTGYNGLKTITYSGPGGSPSYTTSVNFTNGVSTTVLATTLTDAQTTTITVSDGTTTGPASSGLTVNPGTFVKLQILLPGETAAPGTSTGKTGTPSAESLALPFNAIVNAVDVNWNVVSTVTDVVGITSSDGTATLPGNAALASGTKTFSVTSNSAGTWKFTASDITNVSIAASISASVSIARNTDLPNPSPNLITAPAGTLVIPMDNTLQAVAGLFNLKAYGLIVSILNSKIPVRWIIKAGKVKDGIDFTANASQVYPTTGSSASQNFKAGPFLIFPFDTAGVGAIINTYNAANSSAKVNVYQLTSSATVDERYILTQVPKAAIMTDGTNETIHEAYMNQAGIPASNWDTTQAINLLSQCYTFGSEPHNDKTGTAVNNTIDSIHAYINAGGNFLAECAAVNTYENNSFGHFQCTKGDSIDNVTNFAPNIYPNADLSFTQFIAGFDALNIGGAETAWRIDSINLGGAFQNNGYKCITGATAGYDSLLMSASVAKTGSGPGHLIFYCGGHDYTKNLNDSDGVNGIRLYMNAFLTPSGLTACNFLSFDNDLQVTKSAKQATIAIGQRDTFVMVVQNNGPSTSPTNSISANDLMPAGFNYVSNVASKGTYNSGTGSWVIGSMALNESDTLTIIATATASGTITNTIYINKDQYDVNQANDTARASVIVLPCPSAPAVVDVNNCNGTSTLYTTATGSLFWSTGATTSTITVSTAGTYSVTQSNGCTSAAGTATATAASTPPTPVVADIDNCNNTSVLSTTSSGALNWSNGATTSSITVSLAGTYSVTTTVNGCTSGAGTAAANPKSTPSAPVVNDIDNCNNTSILSTTASGGLLWSTGATTSSITVTTGGTYSVTRTVNGCTSGAGTGAANPKSTPSAPIVNDIDNCNNTSTLYTSATGSLLWSNGATASSITVSTAGTYSVTTTINGCTSAAGTASANPKSTPSAPVVNDVDNCNNTSTLYTTASGSLLWNTGATTSSITVNAAGTYSITTTVNGCTSAAGTASANPKSTPSAPTVNDIDNCNNTSTLSTTASGSLLWNTGETTSSITVNVAGTYSVTTTVNGCTSAAGTALANPKSTPSAPTVNDIDNCDNTSTLSTTASGSLLWNTGETTSSITVNTAGTYSVTTTINGCTSAVGTASANPKSTPSAPVVNDVDNCDNTSTLSTTAAGSLLWNTGETTSSITVNAAGTYSVTTTVNGCTSAAGTASANPKSTPSAPVVNDIDNCDNTSTLSTTASGSLLWNTGETTSSITVNVAGTYSVTTTVNGCTSAAGTVLANPKSTPSAPIVNDIDNCDNTSTLSTTASGSLLWNTGETTSSITVNVAGTYSVTTTVNGCTSAAGTASANPKSTPSAPSVNDIDNCDNTSTLSTTATGSLLWNTGATTSSITVNVAGTYSVTTTVNGCTSAAGTASANPKITPSAPIVNDIDNCDNTSTLSTTASGSLLWNTGETTSSITVNVAGTYSVTTTVNGCTSAAGTASANPKSTPSAPIVNDVDNCDNTSTLSTTATGSLLWNTGATTSSITVNVAGTYSVTTTINGCTSGAGTALANPRSTPSAPTVNDIDNCDNTSTLSTTAAGSLLWNTGATTSSITVNAAGTYSVTTTVNGCTSAAGTASANPKSTPSAPTANDIDNCDNTSMLSTTASGSLLWNTGETTSSITVNVAGTYSLTTTINGCTSAAGTASANPKSTPSAPIVNDIDNCDNTSTLSTTASGSLSWNTGETTSSITVNVAGTYSVTTTINGCTSAAGTASANPKSTPSAPIVNDVDNCNNTSKLYTTTSGSLLWNTGETTSSITVNVAGTYSVTTTINGCTSAAGTASANPKSTPSAPIVNDIDNCNNTSTLYTTTSGSLLWNTGETTSSITVNVAGTYSVTTTINGCTSAAGTASANPKSTPSAPIVNDIDNCDNTSTLSTTASGSLLWSTGATTSSITVNAVGTYSVTTTVNGCTSAAGTALANPKSTPSAPIVNDIDNCNNTSTLSTTASGSLLWNTGATTSSITVNAVGTYSVTTTVNGCTSAAGTASANPKNTPSTPEISVADNCDGTSTLSTVAIGNLSWSPGGATTSSITISTSGTYTVTVTNNQSCSASGSLAVTQASQLTTSEKITNSSCYLSNNGEIDITPSGGTTAYNFSWSNGATTQNISGLYNGNYTDTITDSHGCRFVKTYTVNPGTCSIEANDDAGTNVNGDNGGTSFTNVLSNDSLNGAPVIAGQVSLTFVSSTNSGVTLSGANVIVAPGTPAGNYILIYQICDTANLSNCDTALVTVPVIAPPIVATWDSGTVNGYTGGTAVSNVLSNDSLNGVVVNPSQVNTTQVSSSCPGVSLVGASVVVAPGTPAGNCTLIYQICEILNPTNCDTAIVYVTITAPPIVATWDSGTVNGYTGGTAVSNVLSNDSLNGVSPVLLSQVNLTQTYTSNPNVTLNPATGSVNVALGTPAGSDTVIYQICQKLNPTNCDTAIVFITVTSSPIVATWDSGTVNGYTGGTAVSNVLSNDSLNGVVVNPSQVTITQVSSSCPGVSLVGASVVVAPGTPAGKCTLIYQICEILNPTNCDTAIVYVTVTAPPIVATWDSGTVNGYTGGTAVNNILSNDSLNGVVVNPSQVTITQVSSSCPGVSLVGASVVVAPGTPAGNCTLIYQICEILNPTNCDTAIVYVTVTAPPIVATWDSGTVNGYTGGTAVSDVLSNDSLNGVVVNPSQVNTTQVSSSCPGVSLVGASVVVAPGTPAGNCTLIYQICEILNPTNCDTAIVYVNVTAPGIIANADNGTPLNGFFGGTSFNNVLWNDSLNSALVNPSDVNLTFVTSSNPNITLSGADVLVAPKTPSGNYTLIYQICSKLDPTDCDTAIVYVPVFAIEPRVANDTDSVCENTPLYANVAANDTPSIDGGNVWSLPIPDGGAANGTVTMDAAGNFVYIPGNGFFGQDEFIYQLCDTNNDCATGLVTITVKANSQSDTAAFACNSFVWYGTEYDNSASPSHTFTNASGCDSVVTLNLTVGHSNTGDTAAFACNSFTWYGTEYDNSATPSHTFINASGCDSVVTLTLNVGHSNTGDTTAFACNSFTWYGTEYDNDATPTHTFTNVSGCDSVVTLNLTVGKITTPVVNVKDNCGNSVLSTTASGTLTWSTGETTSSITVSSAGTYSVTASASGCSSAQGTGTASPIAVPGTPIVSVIDNCGSSVLSTTAAGSLLWSTTETTSSITVNAAGTYSVTTTVNGCTSAPGTGIANPKTIPTAPGVTVSNNCGSSTLSTTAAGSLSWSTGETTSAISVTIGGTYSVTATISGCTGGPGTGLANPKTIPSAPNVTVNNNCGSSTLSTTAAGSLSWSTGETTSAITVTIGGTYSVTATISGCTSGSGTGLANPKTIPSAPNVTVNNNCGSSTLSTTATGSLSWNPGGATTSSISTSTPGTYSVTQTVNGCTSGAGTGTAAPITIPSAPTISVANNCGSSTLSTTATGSLSWNPGGATTSSISTSTPGTYSVTQTVNGCTSGAGTGTAAPKTIPSAPTISVANNCGSSTLSTTATGSLSWNPGGATTSSITTSTPGTYSVTQTVNGCTSGAGTGTAAPKTIPSAPTISVANNCGSSTLSTTATGSLSWNPGGATTSSISTSTPGTYSVTQTVNGCISAVGTGIAAPKSIPSPPGVIVFNNCGNSVLTTTATGSLLWSTGATASSITVTIAGTYSVTQTVNGCVSSSGTGVAAPITTSGVPPVVNVINNCNNTSMLYTTATGTLLWNTGATTSSITVSSAGTYSVTATLSGCTTPPGTATAAPKTAPSAPGITVVNNCGNSVLATTATGSLSWNTGATTYSITVSTQGTYSVTQTVNGCISPTGTGTAAPKAIPAAPVVTVSNSCAQSVLSTTATGSLLWSTGATTSSITVTTAGTYSVTQKSSVDGCISPAGTGTASPGGQQVSCSIAITTCQLNHQHCVCTLNHQHCNGPNCTLNHQHCQCTLNHTHCFYSTATCQSNHQHCVCTLNHTHCNGPNCTLNHQHCQCTLNHQHCYSGFDNDDNFCDGGSVTLVASGGTSYKWSTGATTASITVTSSGTYSVTVSNGSGCSSTCSQVVTISSPPSCTISGSTSICSGGSTSLCAPAGTGYHYIWSPGGATTQCITVTSAGTYYVTVTNSGGCSSSCNKCVTVNPTPSCSIAITTCKLNHQHCVCTLNHQHCNGPNCTLNHQHCQCTLVHTHCFYSTTTCQSNHQHCVCTLNHTHCNGPNCTLNHQHCQCTLNHQHCYTGFDNDDNFCNGGSVTLVASGGTSYKWSNGATTASITVSSGGTYTVTVTNSSGCTSTCSQAVTIGTPPSCTITGNTQICQGNYSTLCGPSGSGLSYSWSTGANTQCINVTCSGTYYLTVTNSNGCSSTCNVCVMVYNSPSCCITGTLTIQQGQSTTLCATSGCKTYKWSTGATTQCITVNKTGTYSVTVTNTSGCSSTCSVNVTNQSGCTRMMADAPDNDPLNSYGNIDASAYPNPFSSTATIEFQRTDKSARVSVEVYSLDGSKVATLFDGEAEAGVIYKAEFDAANLTEGLYLYKIISDDNIVNGRLLLMRH